LLRLWRVVAMLPVLFWVRQYRIVYCAYVIQNFPSNFIAVMLASCKWQITEHVIVNDRWQRWMWIMHRYCHHTYCTLQPSTHTLACQVLSQLLGGWRTIGSPMWRLGCHNLHVSLTLLHATVLLVILTADVQLSDFEYAAIKRGTSLLWSWVELCMPETMVRCCLPKMSVENMFQVLMP